jgi:hypothetical protein
LAAVTSESVARSFVSIPFLPWSHAERESFPFARSISARPVVPSTEAGRVSGQAGRATRPARGAVLAQGGPGRPRR